MNTLGNLQSIIFYVITIILGFIAKSVFAKIEHLEARMQEATTERQVRQLINDRYDPLAQDIREIKEKLDKLFDMYLDNLKKGE